MSQMVSDYLGTLLNVISIIVFSYIILKQKSELPKWKIILLAIVSAVGLQAICLLDFTILRTFIFFMVYAMLLKIVFSVDLFKIVIIDFFYFAFLILSDMISIKLFSFLFGSKFFYEVVAGHLLGNVLVLFPFFALAFIFRGLLRKFLTVKMKYKIIFLLVISLLCIIAIFFATFKLGTNSADMLLCIFSILVIVLVIGNSFMQAYKNNQLMLQYDNLLSFIKKYETEIDNQRTLRHETKNQLLTIKSKIIDKEKPTAIVDYIDTILNDDRKINHTEYAKLKYLPSNGLKGLFYFKMITAEEKGIHVEVSIAKGIEDGFLSKLDTNNFNQIGKVLGVYLDNAIESAELTEKKLLCIEAFTKTDEVIFVISNTYDPNIKKIGRSTKGLGRGYGLLLANGIISNNNRLSSSTEVTPEVYIKKLSIKK